MFLIQIKKLFIITAFLFAVSSLYSQQIRLDGIKNNFTKKEWLKINGGISASGIFYNANTSNGREPFNYIINGNINFRFFNLINVPLSLNITNTGNNYTYPTLPNRFSLHPSYKWISLHLGDISMSFSPYTLNGHQFTGVGLDLTPGKLKTSIMFGQLLRAVEYNPENDYIIASYKRMGTGAMLRYDANRFHVAGNVFYAKDDENSLSWHPDSLGIQPQENIAIDMETGISLLSNLKLSGGYAISFLKRDIRNPETSVSSYDAFKIGIDYQFLKNTIGIGYERISPDYQTLGAYFFNNDFENITLSFTSILFKDKLSFSTNFGIQRDDLKKQKESRTNRFVGSADITYAPIEKLNININYSNFQTHENLKSQFDYINQYNPTENFDTLNFTQLSQNASLSIFYQFQQTEQQVQNLNTNISYQTAVDKYGGNSTPDNNSNFINASLTHGVQFVPQNTALNTSINFTQNNISDNNIRLFGPTIAVSSRFFEKKLTTGVSSSYNLSYKEKEPDSSIFNFRMNIGYLLIQKHNFGLSGIYQLQNRKKSNNIYNFNLTLSYSYNF
jgi:hypothetical protein